MRCPATLVLGARDQMTSPEAGRDDRDGAEGARAVDRLPAGTSLMAEAPDAVLNAQRDA